MLPYRINSSDLSAEAPIDNYSSLIWTDRYTQCGDFVLTTGDIERTIESLPVGSFLGEVGTDEVMRVETHKVSTNEYGVSELRVEGRSFETFFENRPSISSFDPLKDAEYHIEQVFPTEAISKILRTIPTGSNGLWDENMKLPLAVVILPSSASQKKHDFQVPRGDQYSAVLEIAETYGLGLKTRLTDIFATNNQTMRIDIYKGLDRTVDQSENAPVLFSSHRGDFTSEEFIHTDTNYKNAVYVFTNNTSYGIWTSRGGEPFSGLDLRVEYVDGSDIAPPKDTGVRDSINYESSLARERALQHYSYAFRPSQSYSFQVANNASYKFGTDYNLGDRVSVEGKYGDRRTLQVTEYIRSEDSMGETGYPTMVEYVPDINLE